MTAAGQRLSRNAAGFSLAGLMQGFRSRAWLAYGAYILFSGALLTAAASRGIAGLKPSELLLVAVTGLLVVRRVVRRDFSFAITPVDVGFSLLIVAGTLLPLAKAVLSGIYVSKEMINALAGPIEYFLLYRVMLEALSLPSKLPSMVRVILVVVSLICIIGVLQIARFPGVEDFLLAFFPTYETAESPSIHRATSLVGGWEILAALASYVILLINQIQTTEEGIKTLGRRWNWILIGFLAFNVVALLSTLSTAGLIAIVLGYVLAWRLNGKLARTTLTALGVAAVGALALTPVIIERLQYQFGKAAGGSTHHALIPNTWVARGIHWEVVVQTVFLHPISVIFGVQPNFTYPVLAFGSTESLYLLLLYRGGLVYLAAFLAFIFIIMRHIWQIRRKVNGFNRHIVTAIFTILAVNFVIDILDAHFFSAGEWQLLMTLIAIAVGLELRTDNFEQPATTHTDETAPTMMRVAAMQLPSTWDGRFRMGLVGLLALTMLVGGAGLYKNRHLHNPPSTLNVTYYDATAPVSAENQEFGTDTWQLDRGSNTAFIQGYAGATSANPGETVPLYISTERRVAYDIQVYRMGWYRGLGGRLFQSIHVDAKHDQLQGYWSVKSGLKSCPSCTLDASNQVDAHWHISASLTVGSNWPSGVYLIKLTAADVSPKGESYIPLVVRGDASNSALLVSLPINTYQAYNAWGGYSLYGHVTDATNLTAGEEDIANFDDRSRSVSFNRPYSQSAGSGDFLSYDIHTIRWLERSGFDVSYTTSVDVSEHPEMLLHHAIYLSTGHDEYWTLAMRNGLERARAAGVSLAFFGANDGYWQARLEGTADRTLTCYKVLPQGYAGSDATTQPELDPYYRDKTKRNQTTTLWRANILNRPENTLLGLQYVSYFNFDTNDPYIPDWVVRNNDPDPLEKIAALGQGQAISGGLLGYEFDGIADNGLTPPNLVILGQSQVVDYQNRLVTANTAYYRDPSGAMVFDAGSIWWSFALDEFTFPGADHSNMLLGSQPIHALSTLIIRSMLAAGHVPVPLSQSVDAPQ